jgi:hypothetical protein
MNSLSREITTLNSEKKLSEMAIKGQQNELAIKLRGSMGKEIRMTLEQHNEKVGFWKKIKNGFDNFLRIIN